MQWRLGLDMGTTSLGWSVFQLSQSGEIAALHDSGVRIFSDGREPSKNGKVGDSLAVERRNARAIRRNNDRRISRKNALMNILVDFKLMPLNQSDQKSIERKNPYELRAAAIERKLEPYELGRALFNLGVRRGFKSDRKAGGEEDSDFQKKILALRQEIVPRQHKLDR